MSSLSRQCGSSDHVQRLSSEVDCDLSLWHFFISLFAYAQKISTQHSTIKPIYHIDLSVHLAYSSIISLHLFLLSAIAYIQISVHSARCLIILSIHLICNNLCFQLSSTASVCSISQPAFPSSINLSIQPSLHPILYLITPSLHQSNSSVRPSTPLPPPIRTVDTAPVHSFFGWANWIVWTSVRGVFVRLRGLSSPSRSSSSSGFHISPSASSYHQTTADEAEEPGVVAAAAAAVSIATRQSNSRDADLMVCTDAEELSIIWSAKTEAEATSC